MDHTQTSNPQGERIQLQREVERLKSEIQLQRDEIRALKIEARSYQDELIILNNKVQTVEQQALQKTLAEEIGEQVRLRYLELYRQRIGMGIGKLSHERIRSGDRAAHRGRPVIDALLCVNRLITDTEVYKNLYGVTPEHMLSLKVVPEIIDIAGFHASLQSEGRMTKDFKAVFERFCDVARSYASPMELRAEFSGNQTLQQLQAELQDRYDKIVAANPRGQQRSSSSQ